MPGHEADSLTVRRLGVASFLGRLIFRGALVDSEKVIATGATRESEALIANGAAHGSEALIAKGAAGESEGLIAKGVARAETNLAKNPQAGKALLAAGAKNGRWFAEESKRVLNVAKDQIVKLGSTEALKAAAKAYYVKLADMVGPLTLKEIRQGGLTNSFRKVWKNIFNKELPYLVQKAVKVKEIEPMFEKCGSTCDTLGQTVLSRPLWQAGAAYKTVIKAAAAHAPPLAAEEATKLAVEAARKEFLDPKHLLSYVGDKAMMKFLAVSWVALAGLGGYNQLHNSTREDTVQEPSYALTNTHEFIVQAEQYNQYKKKRAKFEVETGVPHERHIDPAEVMREINLRMYNSTVPPEDDTEIMQKTGKITSPGIVPPTASMTLASICFMTALLTLVVSMTCKRAACMQARRSKTEHEYENLLA